MQSTWQELCRTHWFSLCLSLKNTLATDLSVNSPSSLCTHSWTPLHNFVQNWCSQVNTDNIVLQSQLFKWIICRHVRSLARIAAVKWAVICQNLVKPTTAWMLMHVYSFCYNTGACSSLHRQKTGSYLAQSEAMEHCICFAICLTQCEAMVYIFFSYTTTNYRPSIENLPLLLPISVISQHQPIILTYGYISARL